jgi:hypothetical protein
MLRGCDVSTFHAPGLVPWQNYDFGIVRATYGVKADGKAAAHVAKIRKAKKVLGLYHFFLPHQNVASQVEAFGMVAKDAGLTEGDLLPCVDIEAYPDKFSGSTPTHWADVSPLWEPQLRDLVTSLERIYGGCICYITHRDWILLGQPGWVLERPLWVAHYPKTGSRLPLDHPATPGKRPYAIWQCMVGPLNESLQAPQDPSAVDQNIAPGPLPLICAQGQAITPSREPQSIDPNTIPFVRLRDEDWLEMEEARDRRCREI